MTRNVVLENGLGVSQSATPESQFNTASLQPCNLEEVNLATCEVCLLSKLCCLD